MKTLYLETLCHQRGAMFLRIPIFLVLLFCWSIQLVSQPYSQTNKEKIIHSQNLNKPGEIPFYYLQISKQYIENGNLKLAESYALNSYLTAQANSNYVGVFQSLSQFNELIKLGSNLDQSESYLKDYINLNQHILPKDLNKWAIYLKTIKALKSKKTQLPEKITFKNLSGFLQDINSLIVYKVIQPDVNLPNNLYDLPEKDLNELNYQYTKGIYPLLAQLVIESGKFADAEACLNKQIDIAINNQDIRTLMAAHQQLANIYSKQTRSSKLSSNAGILNYIEAYVGSNNYKYASPSISSDQFSDFLKTYKGLQNKIPQSSFAVALLLLLAIGYLGYHFKKSQKISSDDKLSKDGHNQNVQDIISFQSPVNELLTEREFQVLTELIQGKSNAAIAQELCISTNTVKTHISKIYEKMEVNNRTQATAKARQLLKASASELIIT